MSIANYLKRICVNTAVYWGAPTNETDGSLSYASPIEIKCLWKEAIKMIKDNEGKEIVSNATVYVLQDLDNNGMLFYGELVDLSLEEKNDPKQRTEAYEIKLFTKTPSLHLQGEYTRKAMI